MKYILITIAILLLSYLLIQIGILAYKIYISKGLVRQAHALSREGAGSRMLIVGDSTAVGVGASSPEGSIAGNFAKDFPNLSIENRAVSGAVLTEILGQLKASKENKYDLILIQGGANNVIYFYDLKESPKEANELLALARQKSDHVVMLSSGNAGLAPLFPYPLTLLFTARTREMRIILLNETKNAGVAYVDLFQEKKDDVFYAHKDTYYSADGLHPGSLGYSFWYSRIRQTISKAFPSLVL